MSLVGFKLCYCGLCPTHDWVPDSSLGVVLGTSQSPGWEGGSSKKAPIGGQSLRAGAAGATEESNCDRSDRSHSRRVRPRAVACACALAQCDGLTSSGGRSCSVASGPHNFWWAESARWPDDVVARLYLAGALRDAWRGGWSFDTSSALRLPPIFRLGRNTSRMP